MSLLHKIMAVLLVLACLLTGVVSQKKGAKKAAPAKAAQVKKPACKGKKCKADDDEDDDDDDEEEVKPKKEDKKAKKPEPTKAKGKGKK